MEKILSDISELSGVKGSLLIGKDGFLILSLGNFQNDVEFISACISEVYASADSMTNERFDNGHPFEMMISANNQNIFIFDVNEDTILAVVSDDTVNRGFVTMHGRASAMELKSMLS